MNVFYHNYLAFLKEDLVSGLLNVSDLLVCIKLEFSSIFRFFLGGVFAGSTSFSSVIWSTDKSNMDSKIFPTISFSIGIPDLSASSSLVCIDWRKDVVDFKIVQEKFKMSASNWIFLFSVLISSSSMLLDFPRTVLTLFSNSFSKVAKSEIEALSSIFSTKLSLLAMRKQRNHKMISKKSPTFNQRSQQSYHIYFFLQIIEKSIQCNDE